MPEYLLCRILLFALFIQAILCAYEFEVPVFVGTPQDDESYAVAHDPFDNRFLTGWTKGSLYGTNADQNTTWFVSSYTATSQNQLISARQKSSSASEFAGKGVVISPNNDTVYCCGIEGTRGFVRAFNITNLSDKWQVHTEGFPLFGLAFNPNNADELFVIGDQLTVFKFSSDGIILWNQTYGSPYSSGKAITVGDNMVYFTGYDNDDIVIGQVDLAGNNINITYYGSVEEDFGTGILYLNEMIYITGFTTGNFSTDGQNIPSSGNFSLVVMAVDSNSMEPLWVDVRGPNYGNAKGYGISMGMENGLIYVVGYADSGFGNQSGLGEEDILLAIYDRISGFSSLQLLGTAASDIAYGISVAPNLANFYVTGATRGAIAGTISSFGGYDIFVMKGEIQGPVLNSPGKYGWLGIGIAVGAVVAALLVGGAAYGMYRRKIRKFQKNYKNEDVELPTMEEPEREVVNRKGSYAADWDISYPSLTVGKELGRGAFGVVYKCRWRNTDCVVKQLDLDRKDGHSIKAFLKEANNVRNLRNHPNVCSILGVCTNPKCPICIVMEYLPEGNLLDMIVEQRLEMDVALVVRFAKDIASGMSHLHDENILHCDLACRNLLVDSRGNNKIIKISDFGLSRVLDSETYTASATSAFPVRWTAPEALRGGKLSRASDAWSFGVTLWEMIEGHKPYTVMTNQEVITAVCDNNYRLPRPSHLPIPDSLYELMHRCWQTKPQDRPSFNQIYEILCLVETESEVSRSKFVSRYMNAEEIQSTFGTDEKTSCIDNNKTNYTIRQVYEPQEPVDLP